MSNEKATSMPNAKNLEGKGFDKRPENINRTGANHKSITAIMKQLGNSKKISYSITVVANDGSEKQLKGSITGKNSKETINQIIAVQLLAKAVKGDLRAISEVLDRTEGKPKQAIDLGDLFNGNSINVGYGNDDDE